MWPNPKLLYVSDGLLWSAVSSRNTEGGGASDQLCSFQGNPFVSYLLSCKSLVLLNTLQLRDNVQYTYDIMC